MTIIIIIELHHVLLEITNIHVPLHEIVHVLIFHVHLHIDLVQIGYSSVDHRILQWVGVLLGCGVVRQGHAIGTLVDLLALLFLLQNQLTVVQYFIE